MKALKKEYFFKNYELQSEQDSRAIEIPCVKTNDILQVIWERVDLRIGGSLIGESNLKLLKRKSDLEYIESGMEGCYFIFSNIPKDKVPVLSSDGYRCFDKELKVGDEIFHCLYNGKGKKVKERLKVHLFNSHTLKKVDEGKAKTISGTGAISLVSLPKEEFQRLEREGKYVPSKHKLKPVAKSIQKESLDKREGDAFFLNGIDISEEMWSKYKFGVIVLKSDNEFGKILIEEAFCAFNGRPPLCRRHG